MNMQKTKLGISVGLMGAAVYFAALFGGYVAVAILAGYILICEDNEWLKKTAVKAAALMVCFSLLYTVIHLIPNVIDFINNIFHIFGESFTLSPLTSAIAAVSSILDILEKVLFILLGASALNQRSFPLPVVDDLINKYMG